MASDKQIRDNVITLMQMEECKLNKWLWRGKSTINVKSLNTNNTQITLSSTCAHAIISRLIIDRCNLFINKSDKCTSMRFQTWEEFKRSCDCNSLYILFYFICSKYLIPCMMTTYSRVKKSLCSIFFQRWLQTILSYQKVGEWGKKATRLNDISLYHTIDISGITWG